MKLYRQIDCCRACGAEHLTQVLDLGLFSVSDFKESPDAFTDKAPLDLVRCEVCTLVQLRHTVDRDRLYRSYWYRSGTNESMVRALQDVVDDALRRVALKPGDVVLDIGANDGTLLRHYSVDGVRRWGIEPSATFGTTGGSLAWMRPGDAWTRTYWPLAGPHPVPEKPASIITSIACFYDADVPGQFVRGIKEYLAEDGVWINQLAYLPSTMWANNFGDFCHEHLTYWTIGSFAALIERYDLHLEDWSFNDVNGGSVRFIVKHGREQRQFSTEGPGLTEWKAFAERVRGQRDEMRAFLEQARADGKTVIGYGASTKGNTYLQYWSVGPDLLPLIADRNPDKFDKYTPTGQRVISEEDARAMRPDYFLMLPFHFAAAFVERERAFLEAGGHFVVPFPNVHLHGGESVADLLTPGPPTGSRAAD